MKYLVTTCCACSCPEDPQIPLFRLELREAESARELRDTMDQGWSECPECNSPYARVSVVDFQQRDRGSSPGAGRLRDFVDALKVECPID